MKRLITCLFTFVVVLGFCTQSIYATSSGTDETNNNSFVGFDENGNLIQYDPEKLEEELASSMVSTVMLAEETKDVTYGVVNFRTKASANEITTYTNCANGQQGYLNGYMMSDGAYLGMVNGKVKFKAAGVTGLVDPSEVQIVDYANANTISCYKVRKNALYHYVANIISNHADYYSINYIGSMPSYLSEGSMYYSYDGHYFYTDFKTMIQDYKSGIYTNAINAGSPYYNYFQYLPSRSKTSISAAQLDQYTSSKVSSGKLLNAGSSLVSNQNKYGVNALMMYSNAVLESGWGQSQIAMDKNNLFGHGAADNNPYYGANGYSSVDDCIKYHAKVFISEGFCDPKDYNARYYGSHLGDKESGINVKYASDPYWGEKIASLCWQVQNDLGINEVNSYTIGIANRSVSYYKNPGSNLLYSSMDFSAYPIIILGKQDGYYKVQSDATLNADRTSITQDSGAYDFDLYYAYISQNSVSVLGTVNEIGKWVQDENGNWYWYENNMYVKGWKQIQSKYYYFDTNGVMLSNQWIGNYYVGQDGAMLTSQWIKDRYVDANGLWTPDQWINNDGKWWYRHQDGTYTKNDFEVIDNQTYYFDSDGYRVTGWRQIKSDWYYFNASGIMAKDQWINTYYYVDENGKMVKNKWIGTYYVDANGVWQPDRWVYNGRWWYRYGDGSYPVNKFDVINNNVYYFDSNGYVVTGWQVINGNWYYFNGSGAMLKSQWIGNYYVGKDGIMAISSWVDNNRYYVNENGVYVAGRWVQFGSRWCYYAGNVYAKNITLNIGGTAYTFDSEGYLVN